MLRMQGSNYTRYEDVQQKEYYDLRLDPKSTTPSGRRIPPMRHPMRRPKTTTRSV
jgi:hypothetical protein